MVILYYRYIIIYIMIFFNLNFIIIIILIIIIVYIYKVITNTVTICNGPGRLGNQIIRNLAVSIVAEKHNLYVRYGSYDKIESLGIELFVGKNNYDNTIAITDENYFNILEQSQLYSNLNANNNYFQTKMITTLLYNHLQCKKDNIIKKNKFNKRYNMNDDLFIHIRLTDVQSYNPGLKYYINTINQIKYNNIYIATDDKEHKIIKELISIYKNIQIIDYEEIETIQFGSTCKNIILSHGSFSAIIGYLSFFSNIYYPEYDETKIWYGDMFSVDTNWNKVKYIL